MSNGFDLDHNRHSVCPDLRSKLFAKVISRRQKSPLAGNELNAHAKISSGVKDLYFGLSLYLHPYFVYVSNKGSDDFVHCAGSPEPSLLSDSISTKISCAGSYSLVFPVIKHD